MTDLYDLNFMLDRIYNDFDITKNPSRIILPKLQIANENKKTYFSNFDKLCVGLNRNDTDFVKFLQTELSASTSINGDNVLVIDGMFKEKQIENIIIRYIDNYVRCKICRSLNTFLIKEQRINTMKCNKCNASYSITH